MSNDTFVTLAEILLPSSEIDLLYENNETTTPTSMPTRTTTDVGLSTVIGPGNQDHEPHSSPPLEVRPNTNLKLTFSVFTLFIRTSAA